MLRDNIKPYLDQVRRREITNRELARVLGVSEWHVCRVLKQLKVERDPAKSTHAAGRALLEARAELRTELANDPSLTLAQAARKANCSVRTIYRYRNKP